MTYLFEKKTVFKHELAYLSYLYTNSSAPTTAHGPICNKNPFGIKNIINFIIHYMHAQRASN